MPDVILSVLAHPDDAEFFCAGTLIRLGREHGWQIHIASMTPGDCGSAEHSPEEISRIRRQEGARAAALVGATYHCLEERDLLIFYQERPLERITRLLRMVWPRIVLTHSPSDYMLDHEMTSTLVRAAVFGAPAPNFFTGHGHPPPLAHIPHLYYCDPLEGKDIFGKSIPPGFCIDISKQMGPKREMLCCHASQRDWLLKHHGVDDFINAMQEWSAAQGKASGVAYAEGFRQHLGHSYPQNNLLGDLLGALTPKPR